MIPGLNSIFDRLEGLFGKGYLIGGFLPVLALAFAGILVAAPIFQELPPFLDSLTEEEVGFSLLLRWLGLLSAVGLVGFVFWSLNGWMREVLEGAHLPKRLRHRWEAEQSTSRDRLKKTLHELRGDLVRYRVAAGMNEAEAVRDWRKDQRKRNLWINKLYQARKIGEARYLLFGRASPPVDKNLEIRLQPLRDLCSNRRRVRFKDLNQTYEVLERELAYKPASVLVELTEKLAEVWQLARYGLRQTEAEYERLATEMFYRFPDEEGNLAPTRLGNMAERLRRYAEVRYQMEIDLVLPRLQQFLVGNEHFAAILTEAKHKLDFAVSMVWIGALHTLLWTILAPIQADNLPTLLGTELGYVAAINLPAILLAWIFYNVAVRSYRAWGEVLCSGLDTFRFELLRALHLKLPDDPGAERKLWKSWSQDARLQGPISQYDAEKYEHPEAES